MADVDAILDAQSSSDDEEHENLDLDLRLEEIIHAAYEDNEADISSSLPRSPPTTRTSSEGSDQLGTSLPSQISSPSSVQDAAEESSSVSPSSNEDSRSATVKGPRSGSSPLLNGSDVDLEYRKRPSNNVDNVHVNGEELLSSPRVEEKLFVPKVSSAPFASQASDAASSSNSNFRHPVSLEGNANDDIPLASSHERLHVATKPGDVITTASAVSGHVSVSPTSHFNSATRRTTLEVDEHIVGSLQEEGPKSSFVPVGKKKLSTVSFNLPDAASEPNDSLIQDHDYSLNVAARDLKHELQHNSTIDSASQSKDEESQQSLNGPHELFSEFTISESEDDVSFSDWPLRFDASRLPVQFGGTDDDSSSSSSDSDKEEIMSLLSKDVMEFERITMGSKGILTSQEENSAGGTPLENAATKNVAKYRSALEMAEEAEERASISPLQMMEGVSAQPMRLEGIQNAPPAIGYLQIDLVDSVSHIFSSSTILRDYGTAQALATHGNNLAVGFSKGSVFLLSIRTTGAKFADADTKPILLSSADKSHSSVTSMGFNMQGDLLLVGHANGFLALWDLTIKGGSSKPVNAEHNAAIMHTTFLCTRNHRAITADCKGLVLLHTISWSPFGRYSITKTQCLVDGQRTGIVLCLSPLLVDAGFDNLGNSSVVQSSTAAAASTVLTSMVGGMVRGVVTGKNTEVKKAPYEGGAGDEAGNMVVFVTQQSILVVSLPPFLEKRAMLPRPDGIRDGGIPYIAWRRIELSSLRGNSKGTQETGETKHSNEETENDAYPLLVLAWDKKVFILQLLKDELKILAAWDLDSGACGAAWLDEQVVAILTLKQQINLFTKEGIEIERVNIDSGEMKTMTLSYHAHILNNFGNPEKTYHSSMATQTSNIYLLGSLQVWRARLLPWHERIKALQNAGDWMGAFHVGMEVFDGKSVAVVGIPRRRDLLQKATVPVLLDLLFAYVDEAFTYVSLAFGSAAENASQMDNSKVQAKEQYAGVAGVAIEFCVHIRETDVLFDRIFNKFCNAGQRDIFLELLEPYILRDMLGALAPEVMQGLVEYYSQRGWVQRVEHCVLHMDIASLDFNQVVRLCRENGLYSALIYLFNKGLDDFKSPLEELLIVAQDVSKPNARVSGYKLLVYLKYCFLGLAFPPGHGPISSSRLPRLRAELLQCLLDDKFLTAKASHRQSEIDVIIHPRLSFLLSFDLVATLEVLQCAFPKDGPLGLSNEHLAQNGPMDTLPQEVDDTTNGLKLLQNLIDAMTDILERIHLQRADANKHNTEVDAWQSCMAKVDAGVIMEFISQYVALGYATVSRIVLSHMIDYLVNGDKNTRKTEDARRKENLLVELLNGVSDSEWDSNHILECTLRAQFWQASACLLAKKGDYVAALDSYMKDKEKPENAFLFILDILNVKKGLSELMLAEFRRSTLARLPQLLQLSSEATLVIMLKHFSREHVQIILDLKPYPPLLFQYLKQIMNARSGFKPSKVTAMSPVEPKDDVLNKISAQIHAIEDLSDLVKNAALDFTNEMEEQYVELLCKFEPNSVLSFLKSFEDYRLEHCLKLCQEHGITDAAAYLLERVGDVGSALSLELDKVDHHIHEMDLSVARSFVQKKNVGGSDIEKIEQFLCIPEVELTYSNMKDAIELCQRNTWRMHPGESEALWFRLLDKFVEPLQRLHTVRREIRRRRAKKFAGLDMENNESRANNDSFYKWKVVMIGRKAVDMMQKILVYLIGEIVNGMMGYIPLSVIMDKILSENGKHEFGDFKGTILQILGLYRYEQTILSTAKHVVEDDTFENINTYKKNAVRGYVPSSNTCSVCNGRLDEHESSNSARYTSRSKWKPDRVSDTKVLRRNSMSGSKSIVIFLCGHAAHSGCIFPDVGMVKLKWDVQTAVCPVCSPSVGSSYLPTANRTRVLATHGN